MPLPFKNHLVPNSRTAIAFAAFMLAGCASLDNSPINVPFETELGGANLSSDIFGNEKGSDTLVGLTFSGGGTRAAAFSFGVLKAFGDLNIDTGGGKSFNLLDRVDFVSGVSGGSVTAAYYGLKGRAALSDFRERFLIKDAEESMNESLVNPGNIMKLYAGGANDRSNLPAWLDKNLFEGATFGQLLARKHPSVWINASDIANHAPFVFEPNTFRALCSDLAKFPLSEAVAASAAVPLIFAPVTLEAFPERCKYEMPPWAKYAQEQPAAPALLKGYARALASYRDPDKLKYVRLLDGGLTDNFGLSGITIARAAAEAPYAPLTPRQAVTLKRALFVVVNSGRASETDWAKTKVGPTIGPLISAVIDTGVDSSVRQGFDAFQLTISRWQEELKTWRCKLSMSEVLKLRGSTAGWKCNDVKFESGEVAFDQLPDRNERLKKIATSFVLPVNEVDFLIESGRMVVQSNSTINGFLRSFKSGAGAPTVAPQSMQKETVVTR